jgi:hypothetical protein
MTSFKIPRSKLEISKGDLREESEGRCNGWEELTRVRAPPAGYIYDCAL